MVGTSLAQPRISLVTPCLNAAPYLEETIDSVLAQGYSDLEYVIVDGGSSDGSLEIIRRHAAQLAHWESGPDSGQAQALNKGFARTSGDVMGWINADDVLLKGSLRLLADVFRSFPEVEWLTGQPTHLEPGGALVAAYPPKRWSRLDFLIGEYRWLQQESTFWRRSLWERAGGRVSEEYRLASDFELWTRFFRHAQLHSSWGLLGAFRFRSGQRSREQSQLYEKEAHAIVSGELRRLREEGVPGPESPLWAGPPPLIGYDWKALRFERGPAPRPENQAAFEPD